jgi:hypothetical protein
LEFETQNRFLDIYKCPFSEKAELPLQKHDKKGTQTIMVSFSKKREKCCDANFLSVFGKKYLGENNISIIDINGYNFFPKNPKNIHM